MEQKKQNKPFWLKPYSSSKLCICLKVWFIVFYLFSTLNHFISVLCWGLIALPGEICCILNEVTQNYCHHMIPTTAWLNKAYCICDQRHIPLTALKPKALICTVNAAESVHTVRGEMGLVCSALPSAFPVVWVLCVFSSMWCSAHSTFN